MIPRFKYDWSTTYVKIFFLFRFSMRESLSFWCVALDPLMSRLYLVLSEFVYFIEAKMTCFRTGKETQFIRGTTIQTILSFSGKAFGTLRCKSWFVMKFQQIEIIILWRNKDIFTPYWCWFTQVLASCLVVQQRDEVPPAAICDWHFKSSDERI